MTLTLRNAILAAALLVLVVLTGLWVFQSWALIMTQGWMAKVGVLPLYGIVLSTALSLGLAVSGFLACRRIFRKGNAPEMFFLALFLSTLAGESLVLTIAWVQLTGASSWYISTITRSIWGFRLSGLAFLLCASLFSFDFSYRKYGNLVSLALAAGWAMAIALPIHEPAHRDYLLWDLGDNASIGLVLSLLAGMIAVNFLLGLRHPNEDTAQRNLRAYASLILVLTWVLTLWFGPWASPLALPGLLLLSKTSDPSPYGP